MFYMDKNNYECSRIIFLTFPVFLIVGLGACTEEEEVIREPVVEAPIGYPGVDERLWPYFERFEEEGQLRNTPIDLRAARVTGQIEEIAQDADNSGQVLGQCNYRRNSQHQVTIDENFWNRASDRGREFVVFHELGHCFLLRDHLETAFANGACTSIMRSGTGACRDNYTSFTRDTYLEELFDPERAQDLLP